jgi:two-component system nitrate/nitrite response regulator NarL
MTTDDLTNRERQALAHLLNGLSNKEIARAMGITEGTVKLHIYAVFDKTGVRSRIKLMAAIKRVTSTPTVTEVEGEVSGSPNPGVV